jgi:hypothetical protein
MSQITATAISPPTPPNRFNRALAWARVAQVRSSDEWVEIRGGVLRLSIHGFISPPAKLKFCGKGIFPVLMLTLTILYSICNKKISFLGKRYYIMKYA